MHAKVSRTCIVCGQSFEASRAKFCSSACNNTHRALHNGTCSADDCSKGVTAKGLCRTHYGQQNPNHRRMIDYPCDGCGKVVQKEASRLNRYPTLYCTPKCKTATQWRKYRKDKAQQPKPSNSRLFRSGACVMCSTVFVCLFGSKTCSDACQAAWRLSVKRDNDHRRRARQRNAHVAPVVRHLIYERDNYTCQLCGDPLDMEAKAPHPQSPSIDHTIPLARGGTHEPGNVQAAHFLCNSRKSDRLDWSALAA